MELNEVILGFLDWKPLTGYELKGMFSNLDFLPWSGNNNQIYTALVDMEKKELVNKEVIQQENYPAQKRYSATDKGRQLLRQAVLREVEEPVIKNDFLLHLAWSNCLSNKELETMLHNYEKQLQNELLMCQEKSRRKSIHVERNAREEYIWTMIAQNRCEYLQKELNWLTKLRNGLVNKEGWDRE